MMREEILEGDYIMLKPNNGGRRQLGIVEQTCDQRYEVRIGVGVSILFENYFSLREACDEVIKKAPRMGNGIDTPYKFSLKNFFDFVSK